jgi:hypothetical protein
MFEIKLSIESFASSYPPLVGSPPTHISQISWIYTRNKYK